MNDDSMMQQLHDKATQGATLTEAEQAALAAWYERQDAEEMAQLAAHSVPSPTLTALRAAVSAATRQLSEVTQRIQAQSNENERLRQENAVLGKTIWINGYFR